MTIGERIKNARQAHEPPVSVKKLAAMTGLATSTIYDLERGDSISTTKLPSIAAALGVRAEWLETGKGQMEDEPERAPARLAQSEPPSHRDYVYVGRVEGPRLSAGNGEIVWDYEEIEKAHAFRRDWMQRRRLDPTRCKLIPVKGDSMSPTLNDGDIVMVNLADRTVISGEIYALVTDDGLRVKRLQKRIDGLIWMVSDNPLPKYGPEPITSDQVAVIGRVVWHCGEM